MHQLEVNLLRVGQPRLSFDVLRLVCNSLTDVSDVLSFALICSALTRDAFRWRLRMSPIHLSNGERVDSFHRFIFADEAARAPHIYGLKLPDPFDYDLDSWDPRFQVMSGRVVDILQAAIHVEYIYFPTTVDLDPVLPAVANMTALRELHIPFALDSTWKVLSTFRSPLRALHIEDCDSDAECVTARSLHDHVANLAPTLEVLDLEYYGDFDIVPSLVTTQFTAMRSLTISTILDFNQYTVEILLRLFPALDGTLDLCTLHTTHGEDTYPTWRNVNMELQKTTTWPRLDRLVCNAQCAFLMALRCPIRTMDVMVPRHHGQRYLAPALRHNYPQRLHCFVPFRDGLDDLDGLFPPTVGADSLTHLVLFADFGMVGYEPMEKCIEVPWSQFRDKLVASVGHLRLTHLRIIFHYDLRQNSLPRDSMYTAEEMDLHPAAIEFARAMPTLRYIFMATCGRKFKYGPRPPSLGFEMEERKWLSSKAWRVIHGRDEQMHFDQPLNVEEEARASCRELSQSAAERIVAQEELHLLDYLEHMLRSCNDSPT